MKKELAETLLTKIMGWTDAEKAEERALLESFAAYKYDEYQQFAPGRRFLESLALWLQQFETKEERDTAYAFVKERLIFISNAEFNHLVGLAFPTFVRPKLIADTAKSDPTIEAHRVKSLVKSEEYRARLRKTLFLVLVMVHGRTSFAEHTLKTSLMNRFFMLTICRLLRPKDLPKNFRKT